jgi:hypothetical protein
VKRLILNQEFTHYLLTICLDSRFAQNYPNANSYSALVEDLTMSVHEQSRIGRPKITPIRMLLADDSDAIRRVLFVFLEGELYRPALY